MLAFGLPSNLNPQFTALKTQLDIWLADPAVLKDQSFTVTGHSLGGYLAAAVKQTYSQATDAYLFNAPGVGGPLGNFADALISTLGLSGMPSDNIWNVRGSEGFPIISGLGYQLGTAISIQTEAALDNHSIVGLTDALAVQSLYSNFVPSLGQDQLNALIDGSGNPMSQTLESALDALRYVLPGPDTTQTATGDRNGFYANLHVLQGSTAYTALAGTAQLTSFIDPFGIFASDIAMQAKVNNAQGLATRYALVALNPFVLTGADYSSFNTQGELNLYDSVTGTGTMTEQYLADRAALLERKLWFSTQDLNPVDSNVVFDSKNPVFQNESAYYEDVATGYKIQQGGLHPNTPHYFFGGDGADSHIGSAIEDHLYGGLGTDTLTGNSGNDYLEGGQGFDAYIFDTGDGFDTLLDSDGLGVIKFAEVEAKGSAADIDPTQWSHAEGASTWTDRQNGITYIKSVVDGETRLTIRHGDSTVLVRGWSDGELGIELGTGSPAVAAPSPISTFELGGDYKPLDFDPEAEGIQEHYDNLGNVIVGNEADPDREDMLYDSAANDFIQGRGGDDTLLALLAGEDWLEGNAGRDILSGGADDDLLFAENYVSLADALAQPEFGGAIENDAYGDFLSGGTGDDTLVGSAQSDALMGGEGDDLILGGAGHDVIFGDASYVAQNTAWTFAGLSVMHPAVDYVDLGLGNGDGLSPVAGALDTGVGGNDTIYGGSGGDTVFGGRGNDIIHGESGKDMLDGGVGNDIVYGGADDDSINGDANAAPADHGDDYLDLGEGVLHQAARGGGGNDIIIGGDTDDYIEGDDLRVGVAADYHGNDYIDARGGNDMVWGEGGSDIILGGADNDHLEGDVDGIDPIYHGDDYLDGGSGDDTLIGGGGNDTLIGGEGADILMGGIGDDIYLDVTGLDTVDDIDGNNLIILDQAEGLAETNPLGTANNGTTLNVTLGNGETLAFQNALFGMHASLQFSGGDVVDLESLVATSLNTAVTMQLDDSGGRLYGGAGHDTLIGGAGADTLSGHKGNDTLQGGAGSDTYVYEPGDGWDKIVETGGDDDALVFGEGIVPAQVRAVRWWSSTTGEDSLRLEILDAGGTVTGNAHIENYFKLNDATHRVDRIQFADGTAWADADIRAMVLKPTEEGDIQLEGFAGDDFIDGLGGNDSINGKAGNDVLQGGAGNDDVQGGLGNDTLMGGEGNDRLLGYGIWMNDSNAVFNDAGDDILSGGPGNDLVYGGNGADVYLFGRGDGQDSAYDSGTDGKDDSLRLGVGVLPEHVAIYGSTLVIDDSSTQIAFSGIERIEFDDGAGPVWLAADIAANTITTSANAMTGTSGNDTFVVDHGGDTISEAAGGGVDTVLASRSYTLPLNVENITLTGPLNISATGNALDNILIGNASNNTLDGKDGNDIAYGGQGDDWYANVEQIIEYAGEGIDTWYSPQGGTLPDNVENLYMGKYGPSWVPPGHGGISYGNSSYSPGTAIGNDLDNVLVSPGNRSSYNVLDGRAGTDTMITIGFDSAYFYVDNPGDKVIASSGSSGIDTVVSSVSFTLGDYLERLTLTGDAPIEGYGNNLNNDIYSYDNTAANVLAGGKGDDAYYLGEGDRAVELSGEGDDTVVIHTLNSMSVPMVDLQDIEHFAARYANTGGLIDPTSLGNFDQIIVGPFGAGGPTLGQGGNDVLIGRGAYNSFGAPNQLVGGLGDDTYYVNSGDVIVENPGEGLDKVLFSEDPFDTPLGNMMAENVEQAYSSGVGVGIIGNAGDNYIQGDDSGNRLDGGLGADILVGGFGNDRYYVNESGDQVVEGQDAGVDSVYSSIDYMLPSNLENLTLLQGNLTGAGNALGNVLSGSVGNDTFVGLAGNDEFFGASGNDTLIGGTGSDRYHFSFGDGSDVIEDFDGGSADVDTLAIDSYFVKPENVAALMDGQYLKLFVYPIQTYTWNENGELGIGFHSENQISIRWDAATGSGIERVEFWDGTVWDAAMLEYKAFHHAPIQYTGNGDLLAVESTSFTYTFPSYIFADADPGDVLTWSVALETGEDLPAWLSFESSTRTLSGIPPATTVGQLALRVSATDTTGATASENFMLNVASAIHGSLGDDTLTGGAGYEILMGGLGNDTYVIDDDLDRVIENPDEGVDLVLSSVDFNLPDNVENLTLTGTDDTNGNGNGQDNILTGNSGANELDGGDGNDTYVVGAGDVVFEYEEGGVDAVLSASTWVLDDHIENLVLTGTSTVNGTGNALNNTISGNTAANKLTGGAGSDTIDGGAGSDTMIGGAGDDFYFVNVSTDKITELANEGNDTVNSAVTLSLGSNLENLSLTGIAAINGTGNSLANLIRGNAAINTLKGGSGNDILEGDAGNDSLSDTSGRGVFNGGDGNDTLTGGTGNEMFIGGSGNDTIKASTGSDIIAFNRGDGVDTVNGGTGTDNTISLGNGIRYTDLLFRKSSNDLILDVGASESLTFKNWYATTANNKSVSRLQLMLDATVDFDAASDDPTLNKGIEQFDFAGLAGQFDAARAATPTLTTWALTNALAEFHLGGTDTGALGGDLAYQYGKFGNLSAVGLSAAQSTLSDPVFGTGAQMFKPLAGLQEGTLRLM